MPWHHHLVKTTPKQFTKPWHPKLQSFVVTLVKLYIHARTRTPTHPPSKNRQVRVKIIKKMKMLAQVKVNAECLINCVRENNKRRDVFLSFFFLTWRDNWEKKEEHKSEELSCLFWSLSLCVCVCLSLLCCVKRGRATHTRTRVFRFCKFVTDYFPFYFAFFLLPQFNSQVWLISLLFFFFFNLLTFFNYLFNSIFSYKN